LSPENFLIFPSECLQLHYYFFQILECSPFMVTFPSYSLLCNLHSRNSESVHVLLIGKCLTDKTTALFGL
jgi:hypothetical protein